MYSDFSRGGKLKLKLVNRTVVEWNNGCGKREINREEEEEKGFVDTVDRASIYTQKGIRGIATTLVRSFEWEAKLQAQYSSYFYHAVTLLNLCSKFV